LIQEFNVRLDKELSQVTDSVVKLD